jgi:hypothetical protein
MLRMMPTSFFSPSSRSVVTNGPNRPVFLIIGRPVLGHLMLTNSAGRGLAVAVARAGVVAVGVGRAGEEPPVLAEAVDERRAALLAAVLLGRGLDLGLGVLELFLRDGERLLERAVEPLEHLDPVEVLVLDLVEQASISRV